MVYMSQARACKAFTLLQAATQAYPSSAEAYSDPGVLQNVSAMPEAIASYEESLQLFLTSTIAGGSLRSVFRKVNVECADS
jgi:hypothetical protein